MPKKKPFRSIVNQILIYPILIYILIVFVVGFASVASFFSMQKQMIDETVQTLKISMNQIDNLTNQIDNQYINLWGDNSTHQYMKNYAKDTPREQYFKHLTEVYDWLEGIVASHSEIAGAFSYYGNLDVLIFRGGSGSNVVAMKDYISQVIHKEDVPYNTWELVEVTGQKYLYTIKKNGEYKGGVWIPLSKLAPYLNMEEIKYAEWAYLADAYGDNNLNEGAFREELIEHGTQSDRLNIEGRTYRNYTVGNPNGIHMGILVSQRTILLNMPWTNWVIILLAILSIGAAPGCIVWLRNRIARPVRDINETLSRIGEGNPDAYMPERNNKYENEFDLLMHRFNETMDRMQDAEYSLYETNLKEQKTKLMYISQQIRPHFILNALNIIYTYEEHEFPLVKKLVLYLTQYFRYIVNLNQDYVELSKELRHIQNYLNIQKERYGDRFDFFVEYEPEVEDVLVPPLIIQTFVENCIKYGMRNEAKTYIYVLASKEKERLRLMIADTGNGFSQEKLEQLEHFIKTREGEGQIGVGIQNAVERMDILYHGQAEVRLRNALSGGAVVDIYLPIKENIEGIV